MEGVSAILLLGSNDSEARALLDCAMAMLCSDVGTIIATSKDYESEPYGFTAEQGFVNRAVEIKCEVEAYELLRRINHIEARLGRDREAERRVMLQRGEAYASRPIDIDIIFYGDDTFMDERLTIPYHFLDEREYALRPVVDIAAERQHPALRYTPREMLDRLTK